MNLLDLLMKISYAMIPPMTADPMMQYVYRVRLAIVACTAFTGLLIFVTFSFGWVPGFDGFARASELKTVNLNIIDNELLVLRARHCNAQNPDAKQLYWGRIDGLMRDFWRLTGQVYQLPACADL